jgi:hypothetical protein
VASHKFPERVYAMLHKIIMPLRIESEQEVRPNMFFLSFQMCMEPRPEMLLFETAKLNERCS